MASLRLFNVYGPRSRTTGTYGAVFGVFLAQKLAGKPFTVVGDGRQTRDFTYVTDVADAMVRPAESDLAGEAFNVGSGGTYSIEPAGGAAGRGGGACAQAPGRARLHLRRYHPKIREPRWAGRRRSPSPTGSRGCSSTSSSGATPRCGTSPRWPRPPATGSSTLVKLESPTSLASRHPVVEPPSAYPPESGATSRPSPSGTPRASVMAWLANGRSLRVLVVGEAIVDEYRYCETLGKSGKEPILATRYLHSETFAGGILAVANHVAAICDRVSLPSPSWARQDGRPDPTEPSSGSTWTPR